MATEEKEPAAEPSTPPAEPKPRAKASFPIVPLLNTVALLATMGFFYYSKMIFKRPQITEDTERVRLTQTHKSSSPVSQTELIKFDPVTININPNSTQGDTPSKTHIATIAFSLEIRDPKQKEVIEDLKPFILDQFNAVIGRKKFHELTTVHGRYILQSQIVDLINQLVALKIRPRPKQDLATRVYFTQFIVQ